MFGTNNFGVFLISGIILNLTPGTDTMYILSRSISAGRKAGILSVLGISSGAVIHTMLAAFGLSLILAKSAVAFNMVKYLGVVYLLYLGILTLIKKPKETTLASDAQASLKVIYMQGLLTNLLNPKVALFFLAFLPQFVDVKAGWGAMPFILLGSTFIITGTIWCLVLAITASSAAGKLRRNSKISTLMNKLSGIIYVGLGLNLLRVKSN